MNLLTPLALGRLLAVEIQASRCRSDQGTLMAIDVPSLVRAAGGEIVGKVRLQKMVYLLDQLGVPTGFSFSYHHYGPYSDELAEVVEDDVIFRRVKAERRRRSDGVPYVVYKTDNSEAASPT